MERTNSRDARVRTCAASELGYSGNPRALGQLLSLLEDKDARVRAAALLGLGKLGARRGWKAVATLLSDSNWFVRVCAAYALHSLRGRRAVHDLISGLDDPDARVRSVICYTLGELGDKRAIPGLRRVAGTDTNLEVRFDAAMALVKLGGPEERAELGRLAQDTRLPGDLRKLAGMTLRKQPRGFRDFGDTRPSSRQR